jgi:hypothetical protein
MAKQTTNFGFTKPEINEFYDVNVQNENWDKVDEEMGKTLPISRGGTGSTTATAAITNLGGAKKNHKHNASDIDSGTLSSDRFPTIPITKGGTGAADSSKARENLGIKQEYWTFTLDDGSTVIKLVCAT